MINPLFPISLLLGGLHVLTTDRDKLLGGSGAPAEPVLVPPPSPAEVSAQCCTYKATPGGNARYWKPEAANAILSSMARAALERFIPREGQRPWGPTYRLVAACPGIPSARDAASAFANQGFVVVSTLSSVIRSSAPIYLMIVQPNQRKLITDQTQWAILWDGTRATRQPVPSPANPFAGVSAEMAKHVQGLLAGSDVEKLRRVAETLGDLGHEPLKRLLEGRASFLASQVVPSVEVQAAPESNQEIPEGDRLPGSLSPKEAAKAAKKAAKQALKAKGLDDNLDSLLDVTEGSTATAIDKKHLNGLAESPIATETGPAESAQL